MIFSTIKLLLPALIPSWNFFDVIAPSPRIEYALVNSATDMPSTWYAFRPRPTQLSFSQMLQRLFWNPQWNESLFMMSCAERIMENPSQPQHSENEILKRIINDLNDDSLSTQEPATHVQFRLLVVQRHNAQLTYNIIFYSRAQLITRTSLPSGNLE